MTLRGGPANKLGNRYEGRWTAYCILRILNEEMRSIWLEPVGEEGEGVEFVLTGNDGVREHHQVKRQHSKGNWTLTRLADEGVLHTFRDKLSSSLNERCVFVSTVSAGELSELGDRARSAHNFTEFERAFLDAQQIKTNFDSLREKWSGCREQEAYEWLQRVFVRTMDESSLETEVEHRAGVLVKEKPSTTQSILLEFVLASVHGRLDADTIWSHLEQQCGLERNRWNNAPHIRGLIDEANQRYLGPIRGEAILNRPIPRNETEGVVNTLRAGDKRAVLVTGEAGSGKTGVVAQVVERMRDRHQWPVLVLRMDRLDPSATTTTKKLGEQMDLPESPVRVLDGFAPDKPCLLVIDQLDAVSTASGRHPDFFERVDDLIRESKACTNMRLLLSCRRFDMQYDNRLRRLVKGNQAVASEVCVNPLPSEEVRKIVANCGGNYALLSDTQAELLRTPLHLKLFAELTENSEHEPDRADGYDSLEELYRAYWRYKQERCGREVKWANIIDALLDRLMREQALSTSAAPLDDTFGRDVTTLVSAGVLVRTDDRRSSRLSFFHETFFDYAFARRFVVRDKRLPKFILDAKLQHMFLRVPVRQVLTYARAHKARTYLDDLREILCAKDIRFHLKHLVFSWLRSLPNPSDDEWGVVQECMGQDDADVAQHAWRAVWSRPWFEKLDELGYIQGELDSPDDHRASRMADYLDVMVRKCPERVAEIALSLLERDEPWRQRVWRILTRAELHTSHKFITLYERLLKAGIAPIERNPLSTEHRSAVEFPFFHKLEERKPEWALNAFETWLYHFVRHHERSEALNPFHSWGRSRGSDNALNTIAKAIPAQFVESMLPFVLELARRNALRSEAPPWPDKIWRCRIFSPNHHDLESELIEALVTALQGLAAERPEIFITYADTIRQDLDFETAGVLLARAYTANGERFANHAAAWLLQDHAWLQLGWHDSPHWISYQLLEAITPHCSAERYDTLEESVLGYYSDRERRSVSYCHPSDLGRAQLALLPGFAEERRSPALLRRLGELQRKFGSQAPVPPREMKLEAVGPPFTGNWARLRDENWIAAITKHAGEHRDWPRRGGPWELSRPLESQVKHEPARFARLVHVFPDNVHKAYFYAVLSGLSKAPKLDPADIWSVLRRCHRLPNRPCGRDIDRLVQAYADEEVPDDILALVAWYATEAPDPERDTWRENGGDPSHAGLNSVRGGMAWSVAKLLFEHRDYLDRLTPCLDRMVADPSVAVRTQVPYALRAVLNVDRDRAVAWFSRLCQDVSIEDDVFLAGNFPFEFLRHAMHTHLARLFLILDRMCVSSHDKVRSHGAQLISMAALIHPSAVERADACVNGNEVQREAAAAIAAANLTHAEDHERCERILRGLFKDPAHDVRREAAAVFARLDPKSLQEYSELIEAFIDSRSFPEQAFAFVDALEKCPSALPDVVCTSFERYLDALRAPAAQQRHVFPYRCETLVLRLYKDTRDPSIKRRCLDIFDRMLAQELMASDDLLDERG